MSSVVDRIRNNDPEFDVPSPETVLRASGYGTQERTALLSAARKRGHDDANDGILTGDAHQSQGLLDLLDDVPTAQESVLDTGRQRERQRIETAVQDIDSAIAHHKDDDVAKSIAKWRVEFAKTQIRDIESVTHKSRIFLVVSLVLAVAGLLIDSVFLADAFLSAESDLVTSRATAFAFALILALLLGGAALLSGSLWARSRRPQPVSKQQCDDAAWNEQRTEISRLLRKGRGFKIASIVLALVVVGVYAFFARLRIAQLAEVQSDVDSGGNPLGLVVEDQRGSAKWIVYAIILLALLSLIVFWWEGHTMGMNALLKSHKEELDRRQAEFDQFSDGVVDILADRKNKMQKGLESLDEYTKEAIQTLSRMHESITEDYKSAAVETCHQSKKDAIRAQSSKFKVLQPQGLKQTDKVSKFVGSGPDAAQQPSPAQPSMSPESQTAEPPSSDSDPIDYGAGNG